MARQVQLPSGELATVDNRWLSEALAAADPNTRAIAERLGALIDAQAVGASVDPAVATSTLDDILSRPPFDQPDSEPPGWLADLINWLLEQLGRVAGRPSRAAQPVGMRSRGASPLLGLCSSWW
ncbi:MAG: hypothetical protein HC822_25555 [Oscillochloris sp.]|nr:hypothetical protein [Oscillochloris sp.]